MKSVRFWLVAIFSMILFQQSTFAQKILLQENQNTGRRTRYKLNDEVVLKMRASKDKYAGVITNITDSTITINNRSVLLISDIGFLKPFYKNYHIEFLSRVFVTAGLFYPTIDALNRIINKDFPIPASTGYIAGGFIVTGCVSEYFIHRYYTIRRHKKLRVIDVSLLPVKE